MYNDMQAALQRKSEILSETARMTLGMASLFDEATRLPCGASGSYESAIFMDMIKECVEMREKILDLRQKCEELIDSLNQPVIYAPPEAFGSKAQIPSPIKQETK